MNADIFIKYKKIVIIVIINILVIAMSLSFFSERLGQIDLQQTKKDISKNEHQLLSLNKELLLLEKLTTTDQFDLLEQIRTFKILISMFNNLKLSADFEKNINNAFGQIFGVRGEPSSIILLAYKLNNMIEDGELKAQLTDLSIKNKNAALVLKIYGEVK